MRVLVDGLSLVTASASRGIGTYVRSIVGRMADTGLEVEVLAPPGTHVPDGTLLVPSVRRARERQSYYEQLLRLGRDVSSTAREPTPLSGRGCPGSRPCTTSFRWRTPELATEPNASAGGPEAG
jgi:hypothetical protein